MVDFLEVTFHVGIQNVSRWRNRKSFLELVSAVWDKKHIVRKCI